MHRLGLTAAQRGVWFSALKGSCLAYTEVDLWDLDGKFQTTLEPVNGQVDVNANQPTTRSTNCTLLDPDGRLSGLAALHHFLHIKYVVDVPTLGLVDCPIFTGPVSTPPTRSGQEVTVDAQDPSMIVALGRYPKTYPRNTYAQTIKAILRDCGCVGPFLGDGFSAKRSHHNRVTIGWEPTILPLMVILKLADDAGFQFYFNADGFPVLRTPPNGPDAVVNSLDGLVTTEPTYAFSGATLVNRVQVAGKKPAYQGAAAAALPHPLAPDNLAWNGVPRYYNEQDTSNVGSDQAAADKATRLIHHRLRALREGLTAAIAPLPNLDPLDVIPIGADTWTADSFSLPVAGGDMTVGYNAVINRPKDHRVPATSYNKKRRTGAHK